MKQEVTPLGAAVDSSSPNAPVLRGATLAFVSPKGGTGKTTFTISVAEFLLRAGKSVVVVDTDFSTRGLSLYLPGRALDQADLILDEENCLAESLLHQRDVSQVVPRVLLRDGLQFSILFANQQMQDGGHPESRLLGLEGELDVSAGGYISYLGRLVARLRREYEYVLIDTRGGYDLTSAAAAYISDGYVVVIEADALSINQVFALRSVFEEFGKSQYPVLAELSRQGQPPVASLKGFIVNKALFSADDANFPEVLKSLFGARTFGIVPSDREVIRAYQRKEIASLRSPDSDFAYYCSVVVDRLMSPADNWEAEPAARFKERVASIRTQWAARVRLEHLANLLPSAFVGLMFVATLSYLAFKLLGEGPWLQVFYVAIATALFGGVLSALVRQLQSMQARLRPRVRIVYAAGGVGVLVGLSYLLLVDAPRTFSQQPLLKRILAQETARNVVLDSLGRLSSTASQLTLENAALTSDTSRLNRLATAQRAQIAAADAARDAATVRLAAANRYLIDSVLYYQRLVSAATRAVRTDTIIGASPFQRILGIWQSSESQSAQPVVLTLTSESGFELVATLVDARSRTPMVSALGGTFSGGRLRLIGLRSQFTRDTSVSLDLELSADASSLTGSVNPSGGDARTTRFIKVRATASSLRKP